MVIFISTVVCFSCAMYAMDNNDDKTRKIVVPRKVSAGKVPNLNQADYQRARDANSLGPDVQKSPKEKVQDKAKKQQKQPKEDTPDKK